MLLQRPKTRLGELLGTGDQLLLLGAVLLELSKRVLVPGEHAAQPGERLLSRGDGLLLFPDDVVELLPHRVGVAQDVLRGPVGSSAERLRDRAEEVANGSENTHGLIHSFRCSRPRILPKRSSTSSLAAFATLRFWSSSCLSCSRSFEGASRMPRS